MLLLHNYTSSRSPDSWKHGLGGSYGWLCVDSGVGTTGVPGAGPRPPYIERAHRRLLVSRSQTLTPQEGEGESLVKSIHRVVPAPGMRRDQSDCIFMALHTCSLRWRIRP